MPAADATSLADRAIFAVALNAEGDAPAEIAILPPGPRIRGRDGREWLVDDPAAVVAAFGAGAADLPVDIEHATELRAPKGEPAPAVGWIKGLAARDGGIVAAVEWTEHGRQLVASKAYRYVSPAFRFDAATRRVMVLSSVGLTNRPNLRLPALNSQDEATMEKTALCAALGVPATTADADVVAAIAALKAKADAPPDPTRFAPTADLQAALNRATAAETALNQREAADREAKSVGLVDQAVKDGKIAPASREHYLALCRDAGGQERVEQLLATLPKITDPSRLGGDPPPNPGGALTDAQKAVCRQLGLDEKSFQAALTDAALNN
ncbi:phage protease [Blastochloris tepida]|uniref:Mu phage protease GpI n=1 Tax=Blastochloris tepida TaxID=2233851 RepID=A0A348FYI4_9HYPH|nr:phage protease [Blastochloris tepida]BBF92367.1 Mu phage protease GpI [Blastochloris tepida]